MPEPNGSALDIEWRIRGLTRTLAMAAAVILVPGLAAAQSHGLAEPEPPRGVVRIIRDEWGVPSIYARTIADGYFGLAYAQAADRPEILFVSILAARGVLAEAVAPADLSSSTRTVFSDVQTLIENDYRARLWRIHDKARESVARLAPEVRAAYSGFLAGLNAYIRRYPERIPAWAPRDIDLADLVAIGHWPLWYGYQAEQGLLECARAAGPLSNADASAAKPAVRGFSNEWAVMGTRTASGSPILLSDPHGGITSLSFEYRLHAGALHSAGFAQGSMLIIGRNRRVGWALTTGSPDVSDCYRIRTTDPDNTAYRIGGEARKIIRSRVRLRVKGAPSRDVEVAYVVHNGVLAPIVRELPGIVYVVTTPYIEALEGLHNAAYRINRAEDVDSFRAAIGRGELFPQNLLVADTSGDILYLRAGLTPRRSPTVDPLAVLDGNDPAASWLGIHAGADLLAIKSPADGYLQNNNVHPRWMKPQPPAELSGKSAYLIDDGGLDEQTSRSLAAINLLTTARAMSAEDAQAVATNITLPEDSRWIAMLRLALGEFGAAGLPPGSFSDFANDLLRFDGKLAAESTSALKYVYFREAFRQGLRRADLELISAGFDDPTRLPVELRRKMIGAVEQATERLLRMPQGLRRTYGDEFRLESGRGETVPMSGGSLRSVGPGISECAYRERLCATTLLAVIYGEPDENGQRIARYGSRIMRLDLFSRTGIQSFSIQNPGQAEQGPHQFDQSHGLLSQRRLKPVRFDWVDLRDHISSLDDMRITR